MFRHFQIVEMVLICYRFPEPQSTVSRETQETRCLFVLFELSQVLYLLNKSLFLSLEIYFRSSIVTHRISAKYGSLYSGTLSAISGLLSALISCL